MTVTVVPGTAPSYTCLSTDIVNNSGSSAGIVYRGAQVYVLDTQLTYVVNDDLTLSPYSVSRGITQSVTDVPTNSSSAQLGVSGSFVGTATSTLGVAGIQVSLYTDQNCDVYIEQSPDGNNWDISDRYKYYTSVNNFGITVQAINSYFRTVVKNVGYATTTIFRLQSVLCPIVEALPRSLNANGSLETAIMSMEDGYGFHVENTPNDEMRVVTPYRLVGSTFNGSVVDTIYWTAGSGSGSIVASGTQVILTTGSSTSGGTSLQSARTARYVGGSSHRCRIVMRLPDTGVAGNVRRFGAFTTTDGAFYELSGTTNKVVTRKSGVDTPVTTGSFNGLLGKAITVPTGVKTWEIYWNNSKVIFAISGDIVHTVEATNNTWTDSLTLPIRFENQNSGSGIGNVLMNVRNGVIHRLGSALSQPTSYYHASGQTAGFQLKLGAGNLHQVVVNSVVNGAVMTLADSVNSATPIISAMTASNTTTTPYTIDFKGLPFFSGLRLIVASQNASLTIIYE